MPWFHVLANVFRDVLSPSNINEGYCFNPLKLKLVSVIFKYRVRTVNKTPYNHYEDKIFSVVLGNDSCYTKNRMKPASTLREQNTELLIVKAGGTYCYH
jgi:hypothetical protein